jgi:L-alanine-DL-glutamate epimerase-like enolase superfamily enzyme
VPFTPNRLRAGGNRLTGEVWKVFTHFEQPLSIARANQEGDVIAGAVEGFHNVLVLLRDEQQNVGVGYSGYLCDIDEVCRAVIAILCTSNVTLAQLLSVQASAPTPLPGQSVRASNDATAAISLAAWDLLGRMTGLSCAELWGKDPHRQFLDCYYSGFWVDCSRAELIEEAKLRRAQGYRAVKMRASFSVEADLERVDAVASVFPEPGSIAMEALNSWTADRVRRFLADLPTELLWLEDSLPLTPGMAQSYRDIMGVPLRGTALAAGESCCSYTELRELMDVGQLTHLLPDVGALGGPIPFLKASHCLEDRGALISSHLFPQYSCHLLAGLAQPLPLEVADWWDVLFLDRCRPDSSGRVRIQGPGFGMRLDEGALQDSGERVLEFEL